MEPLVIIKKSIIIIFLLLVSANQCFTITADLNTGEKLAFYMEGLINGNFESFWICNHSFLTEAKAVKQNFPKIMWDERISPIKKKWRKALQSSIGTVKNEQLWDYLYEPGSDVKATVLEVREEQQIAFIQIEYPNYEAAPFSNANDRPRIKKIILNLGIKEGNFDFIEGVKTVNDTTVLYPLDIPALKKNHAREILEKKISSKPPLLNVVTKRMIFGLRRGKDWAEMVQFMKSHGFSYEIEKSNFGEQMSCIHIGCPKDWGNYHRSTKNLFSADGDRQKQDFPLALKAKVDILQMLAKEKKKVFVRFKYCWSAHTPIHNFWIQLMESGHIKKCLWSTKDMAQMEKKEGDETIYKASFKWSYSKGWCLKQIISEK